jgi:hypothetical protein
MKTNILVTFVVALLLVSCENTGPKPEIDFLELGMENSKTVVAGEDLHMEADIVAENKIESIEVEIHPGGDHHEKSISRSVGLEEWEIDTVYVEFSGLKNTLFHEHIEVPENAEPGDYHFHFTVTDMEGYQSAYEDGLEIQAPGK